MASRVRLWAEEQICAFEVVDCVSVVIRIVSLFLCFIIYQTNDPPAIIHLVFSKTFQIWGCVLLPNQLGW